MNSTSASSSGGIIYYHNMFILLVECFGGDSVRQIRCITAKIAGIACGCLLPLIILLGFLGNGFVAYGMLVKIRPINRQNVYVGGVALADSVSMPVFGIVNFFLSRGLPWLSGGTVGYIMQNDGYLGCKMYMSIITVCPLMSASVLLMMVADRAMSFLAPFRFRTFGPKTALRAMLVAVLASALLSIPPILAGKRRSFTNSNGSIIVACFFETNDNLALLYWSLICNPPSVILVTVLLLNLGLLFFITRLVWARKHNLERHANAPSSANGPPGHDGVNGAIVVLLLAMVRLVAQLPTVALYWALTIRGYSADPTDDTSRTMVNSLAIIGSLSLIGQSCSFPIVMRRNPQFRAYFSKLMADLMSHRESNAAGGRANVAQAPDRAA